MEERSLLVLIGVASVLVMAYSLLIAQQILLGGVVVLGVLWIYLAIRFIRAFEQIAAALQQLAEKERV